MLVDMAKWAGQVGQLGRRLKQVTGQNGSFLNGPIGLWVKQVELENSDPFCHVYLQCIITSFFHQLPIVDCDESNQ